MRKLACMSGLALFVSLGALDSPGWYGIAAVVVALAVLAVLAFSCRGLDLLGRSSQVYEVECPVVDIEEEHPVSERLALPDDDLDGLGHLEARR